MSKFTVSRRAFLQAAGCLIVPSACTTRADVTDTANYDYIMISDSQHGMDVQADISIFNRPSILSELSRRNVRTIHIELPYDFPDLLPKTDAEIESYIRGCFEKAGLGNEDFIIGTADRYKDFVKIGRSINSNVSKMGIAVSYFDPWSIAQVLERTVRLADEGLTLEEKIAALDEFLETRFSDSFHRDMAKRISAHPRNGIIFIGSKHAKAVANMLSGNTEIINLPDIRRLYSQKNEGLNFGLSN